MLRSIRYIPVLFTPLLLTNGDMISNESKRKFYEDDNQITPIPGTITSAPASEIESLGTNKIIDGISIRSTKETESLFRSLRETTQNIKSRIIDFINSSYAGFNNQERKITDTLSSLHYRQEDLLPNSLYVLIGVLTGSIIARTRGTILSRLILPPLGGLVTFKYFLPHTFDNTMSFLYKLENENLPEFTKTQNLAIEKGLGFVNSIEKNVEEGGKSLEIQGEYLKTKIGEITGLNLDEEVSKK
ncbi:unnamed protein product [Candida verbasci]|uniref:MICOS complex subunit n=1 Tax=Candida verbasci TaxID=1227364 RepID=A0A9W4XL80_9ASCO|nr:unnamed protein product [Candida verbasci]